MEVPGTKIQTDSQVKVEISQGRPCVTCMTQQYCMVWHNILMVGDSYFLSSECPDQHKHMIFQTLHTSKSPMEKPQEIAVLNQLDPIEFLTLIGANVRQES